MEHIVNRGREATHLRHHAQVLLWADEGEQGPKLYDKEAAASPNVHLVSNAEKLVGYALMA